MSKMGAIVADIDEELANAMSKPVDTVILLNIAKKTGVPFEWVKQRYAEMSEGW
jgi:hypothetical protein